MERGKFIALEGIDGSGTTSVSRELSRGFFGTLGHWVTEEPYSKTYSFLIRQILSGEGEDPGWRSLAQLFSADRSIHCKRIKRLLDEGISVICDRYNGSTVAYQTAAASMSERQLAYHYITKHLCVGDLLPDVVLFLDADVDCCIERIQNRGEDEEIYENKNFLEDVRKIYISWFEDNRSESSEFGYWFKIDANQPLEKVVCDCEDRLRGVFSAGDNGNG